MSTPKEFKQIAAFLRGCAEAISFEDEDAIVTYMVPDTQLNISCPCTREAVLAVAKKYERGLSFYKPQTSGQRQPHKPARPVMGVISAFLEDGEVDNAREYLRQWPRADWPTLAVKWMAVQEGGAL